MTWLKSLLVFLAAVASTSVLAQVRPPNKPGFPSTVNGAGTSRAGHPAIADMGYTPGRKSIIFGTRNHKLVVVNYDGSIQSPFPVTLPAEITSSPAVRDLDGDSKPDIVVGFGSTFEGTSLSVPGGVAAVRNNGSLLWQRLSADLAEPPTGTDHAAVVTTPAIGDVDGDGLPDVAWGSFDGRVYLVRADNGADKPGWPKFVRDSIFSSPALHDMDGDGRPEVIIGVDAHAEGPPFNTPDGGCVHVFRYDGNELTGFPQCVDQVVYSSPAVGDIDGDGKPEIVVGTGTFWPNRSRRVYAFKCDGSQAAGWPVTVDGQVLTAPALADLDADGLVDVVVTDIPYGTYNARQLYAFKGNGTLLWKRTPKDFFGCNLSAADPIVADVLGDANPEVLVPTNSEIAVFSKTGTQLTSPGGSSCGVTAPSSAYSFYTDSSVSNVAVDDMEVSGGTAVEVVSIVGNATDAQVYVFNPCVSSTGGCTPKVTSTLPWPLFRHDVLRTSVVPGTQSCFPVVGPLKLYTLPPCRVVDTRNFDGPQGGPILIPGGIRTFPVAGVCGVPADAKSVAANLTVTGVIADGFLKVYPGNQGPPIATSIAIQNGVTRANNAMVQLATNGAGTIGVQDASSGSTHFIFDVSGYFK